MYTIDLVCFIVIVGGIVAAAVIVLLVILAPVFVCIFLFSPRHRDSKKKQVS